MNSGKRILAGIVFAAACLAAAENYESKGFSVQFSPSGIIRNLSYAGVPLSNSISLVGEYKRTREEPKYDSHFYQTWDYAGKAVFQKNGDAMTVTVNSTLSNAGKKNGVAYSIRYDLTPNRITGSFEVRQNTVLHTQKDIFDAQIAMLPSYFGRGVKAVAADGQESLSLIPGTFNPKYRLQGTSITLSTGKGVLLTLSAGKDTFIDYMDPRAWGGKNFIFRIHPKKEWSSKLVAYPAGTVWKWDFTLSCAPEQ